MNRAKNFCLELSKDEYSLEKLTNMIENEINETRLCIKQTHRIIEGKKVSARSKLTEEKIMFVNMDPYLNALKRYSEEFIPAWYENSGKELITDYQKIKK